MTLIAILFPGLSFILRGRPFSGIIAIALQIVAFLTFLIFGIGFFLWLILAIWAIVSNNSDNANKRHEELIQTIQNSGQTNIDIRPQTEKKATSFGYKLAQDYYNSKSFYHGFFIVLLILIVGLIYYFNFYKPTDDNKKITYITSNIDISDWDNYWAKFEKAIDEKDEEILIKLTSNNFYTGGDNATKEQWINNLLTDTAKHGNTSKTLLQLIQKKIKSSKPIMTDKSSRILEGNGKFNDLLFELKDNRWEFTGLIEND